MAGYVGALLIGLAVGLTAIPLCLARGVRAPPADRLRGRLVRAARRGALGRPVRRHRSSSCAWSTPSSCPIVAVPRRDLHRRRGHAVGRALTAAHAACPTIRSTRHAPAPPSRSPTSRRGPPRPSRPPATRSSTCRTGSTPTRSRPSRSARRPPGSPRPWPGHGFAVEHPAGSLETAVRGRLDRRPRAGRAADRDPRRVRRAARASATAAATTRWRPRAWAPRSRSPAIRDAWAGEVVFLGHAGGGAGERQGDHARRRPVRGPRRRAAVPPLRPQPRRDRAAGVGGRLRRCSRASQAHASSRAVGGPERARRDDRAVRRRSGLWRQQLPPHCRVHGIIQEGGTAANIIPDRTRAWFMIRSADQAYYEVMKRPVPRAVRGRGAAAADVEVEVEFSGCATTMKHNRRARRPLDRERRGLRHRGPGHGRARRVHRHGERVVGRADDPPRALDHRRAHARPLDRVPRRRRAARAPTRRCCSPRRSSPRRRSTCSSTRRSSTTPGASSAPRPTVAHAAARPHREHDPPAQPPR